MAALVLLLQPLLLAAFLSGTAAAEERAPCLRRLSFDGQPPQNQRDQSFVACKAHAANTCCYRQHTELVERRLSAIAENKECMRVSEDVLCVLCDARFGTGELESKGNPVICHELCNKWFNACQDAYVSASPSGSGNALTFCGTDSLICSPLSATLKDSISFCRGMGYEVLSSESAEDSLPRRRRKARCFDGTPIAASISAPRRSREVPRASREAMEEDLVLWARSVWWRVCEVLSRPEVWLLLLVFGYFLYQLVQHAKEILHTQLLKEKQHHRQQILLRYGMQEGDEDEEESVAVSSEEETEHGGTETQGKALGAEEHKRE